MQADKETLTAWRVVSQKLNGSSLNTPVDVLKWLVGVQAQDASGGMWSIGLRAEGCTQKDVDRAIQEGWIVRTWLMRGTLHYAAAEDLGWLLALLAPHIIKANARRYKQLALDDAIFPKSQQILRQALDLHGQLTRREIKDLFSQAGIPAQGQQVPYLLQRASLDGLIQVGQGNRNNPTYTLLPDLLARQKTSDLTKALSLLAERFFTSRGPATAHDFAWWSGLSMKEVRQALESAAGMTPSEADGVEYWAVDEPPGGIDTKTAALLPPFDEYLLGYKDRSLALDPAHARKVNAGGGMFKPTVMLNGKITGTWGYKIRRGSIDITVQTFGEADSKTKERLAHAADHFGRFHDLPACIRFI